MILNDRSIRRGYLNALIVVILCFNVPLVLPFIQYFNIPSDLAFFCMRAIILLFFVYKIISNLISVKSSFTLPYSMIMVLIFLCIYTIRLIYDINSGIKFSSSSSIVTLGIYFGGIIVPVIGLAIIGRSITRSIFIDVLFKLLVITNITYTLLTIDIYSISSLDQVINFRGATYMFADLDKTIVSPIAVGFYGSVLSILCLSKILFNKSFTISLCLALLLGLFNLILGSSRGPLVGFVGSLFVIGIALSFKARSFDLLTVKILLGSIVFILLFSSLYLWSFQSSAPMALNRLQSTSVSDDTVSSNYRLVLYKSAIRDFLDSPLFGKSFLSSVTKHHPHNILLESLMATGIFGSIFFFGFLTMLVRKLSKYLFSDVTDKRIMAISLIPILISVMFSSSLFISEVFWLTIVVFLLNKY